VFNADDIKSRVQPNYERARTMDSLAAIEYIHDVLYNHFCLTYPQHDTEETATSFQDERVMLVMDRYYTKEFYYEH